MNLCNSYILSSFLTLLKIDYKESISRKILFNHNLGYQITWKKSTQYKPQTQFPTIILYHGQLEIITNKQIMQTKTTPSTSVRNIQKE